MNLPDNALADRIESMAHRVRNEEDKTDLLLAARALRSSPPEANGEADVLREALRDLGLLYASRTGGQWPSWYVAKYGDIVETMRPLPMAFARWR